jgi:hypothetical protein
MMTRGAVDLRIASAVRGVGAGNGSYRRPFSLKRVAAIPQPVASRTQKMTDKILDDVALDQKLESIFMPRARAQRGALYANNKRFVHYTSADAALKIIQNKRLWMRNSTCMADYREVEHGYGMLLSFFSNVGLRDAFIAALDRSHPGVAKEAIALFDGWWHHLRLNIYISSISEHEDNEDSNGRLSMWRGFGGAVPKVALVFRIPALAPGAQQLLKIIFSPVSYLSETQVHETLLSIIDNFNTETELLRTIEKQRIISFVFTMLLASAACIKHEGFHEEREWRAIYTPKRASSPLIAPSTEVIGGVPQIVYQLPFDKTVSPDLDDLDIAKIFDRLIIGPTLYPWVMYEAFVDALEKAGVSKPEERIHSSNIPLRS